MRIRASWDLMQLKVNWMKDTFTSATNITPGNKAKKRPDSIEVPWRYLCFVDDIC